MSQVAWKSLLHNLLWKHLCLGREQISCSLEMRQAVDHIRDEVEGSIENKIFLDWELGGNC
jgi:hypothetical protein